MSCWGQKEQPAPQDFKTIFKSELNSQRYILFTKNEIAHIYAVRDALSQCSVMYYIAVAAVLFSGVISYLEHLNNPGSGPKINYDEIILAVTDAINFLGLAYICSSSADRFGKTKDGKEHFKDENPREKLSSAKKMDLSKIETSLWHDCDFAKVLSVLTRLDELYLHLRAAWLLNALIRLVCVTKETKHPEHVASAVAIVASMALLDRLLDLFPETNEALTSEWAFNPLKWVDQLITPALPKTSKTIRAKNEKSARDHGRVSQEQKVAQAVEAATALAEFRDCCGEKADPTFDPKEMEARKKFEFLPGQTDIITELVMSMSLALSSASLMLFGALAEVIAFTLATIQNPENFADLLSAVMSLHAWYQTRSSIRSVARTLEQIVVNDTKGGADLELLIHAFNGAPMSKDTSKQVSTDHFCMSEQFKTLSTTALVVAVSKSLTGVWALLGLIKVGKDQTVKGRIIAVLTKVTHALKVALHEE